MLINIHGFSSNGLSRKSKLLRQKYKNQIICPTLSNIPELAVDTLEQIISHLLKTEKSINLIGSSIGGYLSIYLACKYNLKAVLINPAIYPYNFKNFIGLNECSFDGSKFESTCKHLQSLKNYDIKKIKEPKNFLVLLQKGDELLDYQEAEKKFIDANLVIEEGGSHGFENFESKFDLIDEFFGLQKQHVKKSLFI